MPLTPRSTPRSRPACAPPTWAARPPPRRPRGRCWPSSSALALDADLLGDGPPGPARVLSLDRHGDCHALLLEALGERPPAGLRQLQLDRHALAGGLHPAGLARRAHRRLALGGRDR